MKIKIFAAAFAVAALACIPAFSGCQTVDYVQTIDGAIVYTLYDSDGNPVEESAYYGEDGDVIMSQDGLYYMVTGYSGTVGDATIHSEIDDIPVKGVAEQAFIQCRSITSLVVEDGVETIGAAAFAICTALKEVSLPATVDTTYSTFAYCSSLQSVTLAEGIQSIGDRDFYGCSALTSINADSQSEINIPSSVTAIEYWAFRDCTSLEGSVVIPEGVSVISDLAFAACSGITEFVFEGDVTTLGYAAFSGCTSLVSIDIPSTVTVIDEGAFSYCTSLEQLTLPQSLTLIGASAFEGAESLTSVTMPSGKMCYLYSSELAEDDPDTEEDESVLPGSSAAEDYLVEFYYNDAVLNDPSAKGRIPSTALADAEQVAEWLVGDLVDAFWYFVSAG